ncbi:MAG: prepilin peptidase [archaeon]|jgi:preflagellin peptidase FlaK
MFFYISIILSLLGLGGATYTDLKERIVPNKLNFGMALTGLLLFGINSIWVGSLWPIMYSIFGLCTGFFFGWILWKLGVFAGGDVKLFMALGALNPFTPALLHIGIFTSSSITLFPITLFLHSLLAFLPYGLIIVIYKISKNKEFRTQMKKEMKTRILQGIHASIIIASIYTILFSFTNNYLIEAIIVFITLIIWNKLETKKFILTIILVLLASPQYIVLLQVFLGVAFTIVVIYGLAKLMFSIRPLLSKEISVSKLEEGMIPTTTLIMKGKKVVEKENLSLKHIIKALKNGNLNEMLESKNEIISSNKARGLSIEELKEIKKLAQKGLIGKKIKIKDSMPFVPTMLIGYAISLIVGDAILIFIFGL